MGSAFGAEDGSASSGSGQDAEADHPPGAADSDEDSEMGVATVNDSGAEVNDDLASAPLFQRMPEFVAVYLTFASKLLRRMGELDQAEHYLAELRALSPGMAEAYVQTKHCTASFYCDAHRQD